MHTKMRIAGLLASILTMTALYSVNLRIMGRPNVPLLRQPTIFTMLAERGFDHPLQALVVFGVLALLVKLSIDWFLEHPLGPGRPGHGRQPRHDPQPRREHRLHDRSWDWPSPTAWWPWPAP